MIDVAWAIDAEAVPVTLRTFAGGTYDAAGNGIPGAPSDAPAMAAVQPVSGRMLQDLPEGIRTEVSHVGWTRSSVDVGNEIVYGGETYRVAHVWPRPMDGFNKFALKRAQG